MDGDEHAHAIGCTQVVTAEVNMRVALLITELMRFQTRAILKDEIKGRMRKRVVFGFREVRGS